MFLFCDDVSLCILEVDLQAVNTATIIIQINKLSLHLIYYTTNAECCDEKIRESSLSINNKPAKAITTILIIG